MSSFAYFHIPSLVQSENSPVEEIYTFIVAIVLVEVSGLLFIKGERGLIQPDIVFFGKGMGKLPFNFPKLYFKLCVAAIPDKNRAFI